MKNFYKKNLLEVVGAVAVCGQKIGSLNLSTAEAAQRVIEFNKTFSLSNLNEVRWATVLGGVRRRAPLPPRQLTRRQRLKQKRRWWRRFVRVVEVSGKVVICEGVKDALAMSDICNALGKSQIWMPVK